MPKQLHTMTKLAAMNAFIVPFVFGNEDYYLSGDENQRETIEPSAEPPSPSKLHTLHTVSESENRKKTSKPSGPSTDQNNEE